MTAEQQQAVMRVLLRKAGCKLTVAKDGSVTVVTSPHRRERATYERPVTFLPSGKVKPDARRYPS